MLSSTGRLLEMVARVASINGVDFTSLTNAVCYLNDVEINIDIT